MATHVWWQIKSQVHPYIHIPGLQWNYTCHEKCYVEMSTTSKNSLSHYRSSIVTFTSSCIFSNGPLSTVSRMYLRCDFNSICLCLSHYVYHSLSNWFSWTINLTVRCHLLINMLFNSTNLFKGSNMILCVLLVSNSRWCCLAPRRENTRGSLTPTIHTQSCLIPIITWCHHFFHSNQYSAH